MALKTRILLRNDELSNWTGSDLVLGKGEVAIATGLGGNLVEVRVGVGENGSTWANSAKLAIDASQISGIVDLIESKAKKYQVVADGEGGNSWKLQEAYLSGGDWTDVTSSTWSVDFTAINNAITGLTADVSYLSGQIGATNATLNTVSSDYLKAADKNELTTSIDTKLAKTDFAILSNAIGLSAASASNQVATKADISALDGVMHFKGVVNAVPVSTEGYEVGDVVLVTGSSVEGDNGKEFVLVEVNETKKWEQIGDQDHYATKSYVDTGDSNTLTASKAYTDGKITDISGTITSTYATKTDLTSTSHALSTDYNTKIENITSTYATKEYADSTSAYALREAKEYTETLSGEVEAISAIITSDYAEKTYVNGISAALSTETHNEITAVVGQDTDLSTANTIYGAKKYAEVYSKGYTDAAIADLGLDNYATKNYVNGISSSLSTDYVSKIDALSGTYIKHGQVTESDLSGFFILDCGGSALRDNEPAPSTGA